MSVFVIAELGINHNGDPVLCREMIAAAASSGANAVKLQINNPKNISANPWLIDVQERTKLDLDSIHDLIRYSEQVGIEIFSSVGDVEALSEFSACGFKRIKISSSNLLNAHLHEAVSDLKIPVLLSTGDADLRSILRVVNIYQQSCADLTLLHCIPQYPTQFENAALSAISYLNKACKVQVGFSDHSIGDFVAGYAVAAGAVAIEKHFTLNREDDAGPDHHFSADPDTFLKMVKNIRQVEAMMGEPDMVYSESSDRTKSLVRRALVFRTPMTEGTLVEGDKLLIARPVRQVAQAINPLDYRQVVGKVLVRDIEPFEALTWECLADSV